MIGAASRIGRSLAGLVFTCLVTTGSDKPALCRSEGGVEGHYPELTAIQIYVSDHLVVGQPGSAAENAEAVLRISFGRHNSAFSRLSLRISRCSSENTPG